MAELTQAIECPVPGFEGVTIHFNMLAPESTADAFAAKAGRGGSAEGIVTAVDGWDEKTYGDDPWDYERSPMAFRVWAAKVGYGTAVKDFVTDPNL